MGWMLGLPDSGGGVLECRASFDKVSEAEEKPVSLSGPLWVNT